MTKIKTLKDLKLEIKAKRDEAGGLPSAKALYESNENVICKDDFGNPEAQELLVYANGLVYYRSGKHRTVFRIHKVNDEYYKESKGFVKAMEGVKHPLIPWNYHLMMVGEDRIFSHLEEKEYQNGFSLNEMRDENQEFDLEDVHAKNVLSEIIAQEELEIIYWLLTDKQREVFQLYFEGQLKHEEIAEILGMERSGVTKLLSRANKKIIECQKMIF